MKTKEHWTLKQYKENYEKQKRALETFSSDLLEILSYESPNISEKGLKSIIRDFGELRRVVYVNGKKNKELFFRSNNTIENQFLTIKKITKK